MNKNILTIAAYIALAFVAVQGCLLIAKMFMPFPPEQAAEDFLLNLQRDRLEEAYYSTAKQFQGIVDYDGFAEYLEDYPELFESVGAVFDEQVQEIPVYTLVGKVTSSGGQITPVTFQMMKEDEKWRVLSVALPDYSDE